ncbi:MAG: HAMP domain-containing protein, partial [Elusimicrobiota bacterium]
MRRRSFLAGRTLKFKIMAGVIALVALFGVTVMGNIHRGLSDMFKEELIRRGVTIAHTLAHSTETALLTQDEFALRRMCEAALRSYDDVRYVFVLNREGRVMAHSFAAGFPSGLGAVNPAGEGASPGVRRLRTEEGVIQDIALPLSEGRTGTLHVGMKEYRVRRRLARMIMFWGLLAASMLLLGAGVAYWLTLRLTHRLESLVQLTKQVGSGRLDSRAEDDSDDEVGQLAQAFNAMTEDLKRTQKQLIRSGELAAIGELAGSVAHEINNPLNTMAVCTQSLLARAQKPGPQPEQDAQDHLEYLKAINDEIFRCKRITTALLDFARFREPRRSRTDLNELIRDTLVLASHQAEANGVRLDFTPALEALSLEVDADQIKQVVLNLVINALEHVKKGGEVRVAPAAARVHAVIPVADTGGGIAPTHLAKV